MVEAMVLKIWVPYRPRFSRSPQVVAAEQNAGGTAVAAVVVRVSSPPRWARRRTRVAEVAEAATVLADEASRIPWMRRA